MIGDALYCRSLALRRIDFESITQAARKFGRPIAGFNRTKSTLAWNELISFEQGGWSWASGAPTSKIEARISVCELHALSSTVSIFGVVSAFSSLSSAGFNYLMRPFMDNREQVKIDLPAITQDRSVQPALTGFSYELDGVFHNISTVTAHEMLASVAPGYPATLHSVRLRAATALVEVEQSLDLAITAEPGAPEYAIEDSRQIFGMIADHIR